jgi:protein phosphatase
MNGPYGYDVIGDVHGCYDELQALLALLQRTPPRNGGIQKLVFIGDLVNRGPRPLDVLEQAMNLVEGGHALCILGNHDAEFLAWIDGRSVDVTRLAPTIGQWSTRDLAWRNRAARFLRELPGHLMLDGGRLCVAHAGLHAPDQGSKSRRAHEAAVHGRGLMRDRNASILNWSDDYVGSATVIHGHLPIVHGQRRGRVWNIDTGCCFGGHLSALRYPEETLFSVPSRAIYADLPARFYASAEPPPIRRSRTHLALNDQLQDVP